VKWTPRPDLNWFISERKSSPPSPFLLLFYSYYAEVNPYWSHHHCYCWYGCCPHEKVAHGKLPIGINNALRCPIVQNCCNRTRHQQTVSRHNRYLRERARLQSFSPSIHLKHRLNVGNLVEYQFLTAVVMMNFILWDIKPRGSFKIDQLLRTRRLHFWRKSRHLLSQPWRCSRTFLRKVCWLSMGYIHISEIFSLIKFPTLLCQ
jgi:hypothetical protein